MGKPVAGDIVVLPFPQTDLKAGKRRRALVVANLAGDDLILCQITSRARSDQYSVAINANDFGRGQLSVDSYARPNRLFTVEHSVIAYVAARLGNPKLDEVKSKLRQLFT